MVVNIPPPALTAARRSDAGTVRLSERDVAGLLLCGEQYGAPYDLLVFPAAQGEDEAVIAGEDVPVC